MRGKQAPQRNIKPDPRFGRQDMAKLTNYIMRRGKKTVAQKIVYDCLDIIMNTAKKDPFQVYSAAMKNVGPNLEIRGRRVGGANYQVPFPVNERRKQILFFRWIIAAAKARKGLNMARALAAELIDAAKGEGAAVKKREDVHRMAEANKAFAHFARFSRRKKK